jgi:hypothetical protein
MIHKNYYLSEKQVKLLEKEAKELTLKPAELLRRILDKHYEEKESKKTNATK